MPLLGHQLREWRDTLLSSLDCVSESSATADQLDQADPV